MSKSIRLPRLYALRYDGILIYFTLFYSLIYILALSNYDYNVGMEYAILGLKIMTQHLPHQHINKRD